MSMTISHFEKALVAAQSSVCMMMSLQYISNDFELEKMRRDALDALNSAVFHLSTSISNDSLENFLEGSL